MDQDNGQVEPAEVLLVLQIRVARYQDVVAPGHSKKQFAVLHAFEPDVFDVVHDMPGMAE